MMPTTRFAALVTVFVSSLAIAACGIDSTVDSDLSPEAQAGASVSRASGCAACHGRAGQGGVGPPFVGLWGSQVEFDDGSTLIADEAYIIEAIIDPGARRVTGYNIPMPRANLSDSKVASLVAYIEELGARAADDS